MKPAMLASLLLAALSGAAAVAAPGAWDFFPDSGEMPSAWHLDNQTAYPDLGLNAALSAGAGLLTIALKDYSGATPGFYFSPGALCNGPDTVMSDKLQALLPVASATKRRLASRALLQAPTTFTITDPCDLQSVTATLGDGDAATLTPTNGVYQFQLPANTPDGLHCVVIKATYSTGPSAFATTPAYATTLGASLPASTTFTRTVCMFKLTRQATADLTFDMCATDAFTVNISSVAPLPVNLTLDGAPVQLAGAGVPLLRPLIKVWGGKTAALDGTPTGEAYDAAEERDLHAWVSKFIPLAASYAGEEVAVPLSSELQEGYYNLSAAVSLITDFPRLVNLTGLNGITQDDESGTSSGVTGMYEAATFLLFANTSVGVQKASTPTTLSALAVTSHAPFQAVKAGDALTLTWQFNGVGSATCAHDAAAVSNAPNGKCVSPLAITAKSLATGVKANVTVTFTDACKRVRTAQFSYSTAGVTAVTPTEVLNSDGTITLLDVTGSPTASKPRPTGAAATRGLSGALAAAAAGGALLAALL